MSYFFYVPMTYFVFCPELRIYSQGVWFFDEFENIIHELRRQVKFNLENLNHKFFQIAIFFRCSY